MFGVLDRYIGRTIFNTIMMTLFMLVSLSGSVGKCRNQASAEISRDLEAGPQS